MYTQVFENLCKTTEATVQFQQDLFRRWTSSLPGMPTVPSAWVEQVQTFQKKWTETFQNLLKKQQGSLVAQCQTGRKLIEEALTVTSAKNPEEFRAKVIESWQKSYDSLRELSDAHVRDFQDTMQKWLAEVSKVPVMTAPVN